MSSEQNQRKDSTIIGGVQDNNNGLTAGIGKLLALPENTPENQHTIMVVGLLVLIAVVAGETWGL